MFDVGPGEFFTIALIALLVFGPQRLPEIARKLGGYLSEIRKAAGDLRAGLDEEVRQIQEPLEEIKKDLTKPVSEIKGTFDETARAVNKEADEAAGAIKKELKGQKVEWIGPEPTTGPKPEEAWEGVEDPVPDEVQAVDQTDREPTEPVERDKPDEMTA